MSSPYGELQLAFERAQARIHELEKREWKRDVESAIAVGAYKENDQRIAEAARVEAERLAAWQAHGSYRAAPAGWPRGEGPSITPVVEPPQDISNTLLGKAVQ
jgi:hypothetical protein